MLKYYDEDLILPLAKGDADKDGFNPSLLLDCTAKNMVEALRVGERKTNHWVEEIEKTSIRDEFPTTLERGWRNSVERDYMDMSDMIYFMYPAFAKSFSCGLRVKNVGGVRFLGNSNRAPWLNSHSFVNKCLDEHTKQYLIFAAMDIWKDELYLVFDMRKWLKEKSKERVQPRRQVFLSNITDNWDSTLYQWEYMIDSLERFPIWGGTNTLYYERLLNIITHDE